MGALLGAAGQWEQELLGVSAGSGHAIHVLASILDGQLESASRQDMAPYTCRSAVSAKYHGMCSKIMAEPTSRKAQDSP